MNVISWSGGNDSTIMMHYLLHETDLNYKIVFVDSTITFPETLTYIQEVIECFGIRTHYVELKPKMTFWERLAYSQFWSAINALWCREYIKKKPLRAYYRSLGEPIIYDHVGVSLADSVYRNKLYSSGSQDYRVRGPHGYVQIKMRYPLLGWTDKQKAMYAAENRIPKNPCYATTGVSGCYVCPFFHEKEYLKVKYYHPKLFEKICTYERLLKKRCNAEFWVSSLAPQSFIDKWNGA